MTTDNIAIRLDLTGMLSYFFILLAIKNGKVLKILKIFGQDQDQDFTVCP